jgi:ferredoxin-NADP reductase
MDAVSWEGKSPVYDDSGVFICSPELLHNVVRKATKDQGLPKNCIHDETFAFQSQKLESETR